MKWNSKKTFLSLVALLSLGATASAERVQLDPGAFQKQSIAVETQFSQGLSGLLLKIRDAGTAVKSGKMDAARQALTEATREYEAVERNLSGSSYAEIRGSLNQARQALSKADASLQKNDSKTALTDLAQAYRWTKALSESPVLKFSTTEQAIQNAADQIRLKDYRSANLFLQQAIDGILQIEKLPGVNLQEIKKIKSDIVLTQHQVTLGKLSDEKKLDNFYPGLAAARTNTLNSYYDIWSRSDLPWEQH